MKAYKVIFHTSQIGQNHEQTVLTGVDEKKAREYAKRGNRTLSKGEKTYYRMRYTVRQDKARVL